jgi:pyrroloquinoline quinone biosynthesis protein E
MSDALLKVGDDGAAALNELSIVAPVPSHLTPEPAIGSEAYTRERELALAASDEKRKNYERYLATARGDVIDYLPIKLDVENVSRCNFRCTMCVVSDWDKGKRADDLSLEAFKALIDEQHGLVEIKLQGIGEPTMQGDDFFAMIRYARERHIWVRTTTNASLLHLKDNWRKLIDADPNEVQISIDGADAETFQSIRRGSVFKQVIENCSMINDYCHEKGVHPTKMWTVVQRENVDQCERLVDLAADLGFRSHVFAFYLSDWGLESWRDRNDGVAARQGMTIERMQALADQGAERGVKVRYWDTQQKYSTASPDSLCPWPFERSYYSSDQRVSPCCLVGNPDVYEIGDGGSMTDVWTSDDYAEFRRAHLEGRVPRICQSCYTGLE